MPAMELENMTTLPTIKKYDHIQLFVDKLQSVETYKRMESSFSAFSDELKKEGGSSTAGRNLFVSKHEPACPQKSVKPEDYSPTKQDIIQQLICGLGWGVTGVSATTTTKSVLVSSPDAQGVKVIVTARADENTTATTDGWSCTTTPDVEPFAHFSGNAVEAFMSSQKGNQGIAVLAFEVECGGVETVRSNLLRKHGQLLASGPHTYTRKAEDGRVETTKVLDMWAYYAKATGVADKGTRLRFIERSRTTTPKSPLETWATVPKVPGACCVLPGLERTEATFGAGASPAYFDHWVSNVVDRVKFLAVLKDVLGFEPKVDFNAGVVAAGEAIIESTVAGNTSTVQLKDAHDSLVDQSQVYLPINNTLAEVGHVDAFLKQVGQGVQHVASRVPDLVGFVQAVNDRRTMTGQGFSFLRIPRSYYGRLTAQMLVAHLGAAGTPGADAVLAALEVEGLMDGSGIVGMDVTAARVAAAVETISVDAEVDTAAVAKVVLRSRWSNMRDLLGDAFDDATYEQIVRNQVLVDIQGDDILLQIFTANVLQRNPGEEAPFFEFIQRVCAVSDVVGGDSTGRPIKPGCGGFGIRNFLALFLSIEVSKALDAVEAAISADQPALAELAQRQVDTLTSQMDEANPVLTQISDAMTKEGEALDVGDNALAATWCAKKEAGNVRLQEISDIYKAKMVEIRQLVAAASKEQQK